MNSDLKPLFLLTNDDGYQAAGLQALARAVAPLGEVYVVAPDGARSGAAASITCTTPVLFRETAPLEGYPVGSHIYACSGTPVDCIKLAMEQILPRRPNLILSGINHGDNASVSVHYSGTMGAVFEGCMKGIPSVGVSLYLKRGQRYEDHPVGDDTLAAITALCQRILQKGLPDDVCLNINLPTAHVFRGWQVCRQARGQWSAEWVSATHPFGQHAFWLTGTFTDLEPEATDTDFSAIRAGYCSIVPVHVDMTARDAMASIQQLI
ncbi:MAG: 5'/3'-nucleotidase SurE [Bacteroidales bacterium]|nr:5'/3'-nucleotidase SurE [Bacteroidales bacterium]